MKHYLEVIESAKQVEVQVKKGFYQCVFSNGEESVIVTFSEMYNKITYITDVYAQDVVYNESKEYIIQVATNKQWELMK